MFEMKEDANPRRREGGKRLPERTGGLFPSLFSLHPPSSFHRFPRSAVRPSQCHPAPPQPTPAAVGHPHGAATDAARGEPPGPQPGAGKCFPGRHLGEGKPPTPPLGCSLPGGGEAGSRAKHLEERLSDMGSSRLTASIHLVTAQSYMALKTSVFMTVACPGWGGGSRDPHLWPSDE